MPLRPLHGHLPEVAFLGLDRAETYLQGTATTGFSIRRTSTSASVAVVFFCPFHPQLPDVAIVINAIS